jgi:hypothetical protein
MLLHLSTYESEFEGCSIGAYSVKRDVYEERNLCEFWLHLRLFSSLVRGVPLTTRIHLDGRWG